MVPFIVPILAWTGGIAAGAQVAGGVVRGAGELARGNPGAALIEVADGVLSPFAEVYRQVVKLGGDAIDAVVGAAGPGLPEMEVDLPRPPFRPRRPRRRATILEMPSANGEQAG